MMLWDWMDEYLTVNDLFHFSCIMDSKTRRILWLRTAKRYWSRAQHFSSFYLTQLGEIDILGLNFQFILRILDIGLNYYFL